MSRKSRSAPVKPTATTSTDSQLRELVRQYRHILGECRADLLDRELAELSRKTYKRPLVLFFGRNTFTDNTKYLYLEAVRTLADYDVVWCTANPALAAELTTHGLPCLDMTADPTLTTRELLQCSVAVFCENMLSAFSFRPALAGALAGAQKLQLWHGISVKQLDLMLLPYGDVLDANFRQTLLFASRPDVFLSTAACLDAFWVHAHGGRRLVRAGQPRNAVLLREATAHERIGATLPGPLQRLLDDPATRCVLVAPTWKRGQGLFTSTAAFHDRLAAWAAANDTVVFIKAHPFMTGADTPATISGRLHVIDAGIDIYPSLARFDALVTDLSSIMFDFLLTGKPIFTFEAATQTHVFEPDWSLVPDTPFRYAFDERTMEAVLTTHLDTHTLAASQRVLASQLYETDPLSASADLVRVIEACHSAALDRPVDVIEMDPEPAEHHALSLAG